VTLNHTVTNALMSSVYVIHMCLFFDTLLSRLLFLVSQHAVDHFQNITGIYEEAEVGSFRARPGTKFNNLPTCNKIATDAFPFK
jgi:hypothetical protein